MEEGVGLGLLEGNRRVKPRKGQQHWPNSPPRWGRGGAEHRQGRWRQTSAQGRCHARISGGRGTKVPRVDGLEVSCQHYISSSSRHTQQTVASAGGWQAPLASRAGWGWARHMACPDRPTNSWHGHCSHNSWWNSAGCKNWCTGAQISPVEEVHNVCPRGQIKDPTSVSRHNT